MSIANLNPSGIYLGHSWHGLAPFVLFCSELYGLN